MPKNEEVSLSSLGIQIPYNMQAEQSVLGAALMDETVLNRLITDMEPEMFYSEQNRAVFETMRMLYTDSEAVDVITLVNALATGGLFASADDAKVYITRLAEECDRWNLPLIVEPTTWGATLTDDLRAKVSLYADMARISAELGADLVKCDYVGTPEEYQAVVDNCPVPVAILGGAKAAPEHIADTIESAASCGVCGVVFGRNVWQSEDPARMVQALKAITYRGDREEFLRLSK